MKPNAQNKMVEFYLSAREAVVTKGFAAEIDWQESRSVFNLSEKEFLQEAAWVVLNAGMRERIMRKVFPQISNAFLNWVSAEAITKNRSSCEGQALKVFNHARKISAIGSICSRVAQAGFDIVREKVRAEGVDYLQTLDFIGPITKYHLAKNIGLDVVKPDRHLVRLAKATKFKSPDDLCQAIANVTGDKISVIDLVLWRYSTLSGKFAKPLET